MASTCAWVVVATSKRATAICLNMILSLVRLARGLMDVDCHHRVTTRYELLRVTRLQSPIGGCLNPVKLRVLPSLRCQLRMRADFDDVRAVEHYDQIRHPHGREAVRYENRDATIRPPRG